MRLAPIVIPMLFVHLKILLPSIHADHYPNCFDSFTRQFIC
jgi:hypothetical protein